MEGKEEIVKISFFKKVWYSITKFEQYPNMAGEGLKQAIKYLIILMTIVTITLMVGSLMEMHQMIGNLSKYIDENIPDFSYADGKISMEMEAPMVIDEIKYTGIDKIVINPLAETVEQKEQSEKEYSMVGTTIYFFKDQIILESKTENDEIAKQPYTYSDFIASYTGQDVETFNKAQLVEYLTSENMIPFYTRYALSLFVYLLIVNIMMGLLDALEIAILGWITAIIAGMKLRFSAMYNMAVYSLTLPIFLNILYIIINYFTDFTITYFRAAYIIIAYIYLAATIFIIKDDLIKRIQEVEKIKQEQEKVREEIKEQERQKENRPEKKENDREDKKEDEQGEEPKGSEA